MSEERSSDIDNKTRELIDIPSAEEKDIESKNCIQKKQFHILSAFNRHRNVSSHFIITTIFVSNFIGIAFARTLHYQFYVWYFHTIPYLLWHSVTIPVYLRCFVFLSIEIAFNVYPATWWSSLLLQVKWYIVYFAMIWVEMNEEQSKCYVIQCRTLPDGNRYHSTVLI